MKGYSQEVRTELGVIVENFLDYTDAISATHTLEELFEGWLSSDLVDNSISFDRMTIYRLKQELTLMFTQIDACTKNHKAPKPGFIPLA